ncbi:hypothetical protein C2E25_02355 [Geothermobacter hydrogeniphilus]|uniref:Cyclic nucleotide-binding domain-containing protein n=1 Tax=Geothermobacter hydrogeniphilus TaxID=1969733 RepID=A0A2K2HDP4_9BACT|nr:hypothetical protein C2E25_02355 [Geothermobacter hydrogeniphilus]
MMAEKRSSRSILLITGSMSISPGKYANCWLPDDALNQRSVLTCPAGSSAVLGYVKRGFYCAPRLESCYSPQVVVIDMEGFVSPLWSNIFRQKPEEESLAYFLGTLPLFSDMTERELKRLETLVHVREYDAGETVFSEGDPGSGLYIVRTGRVRISSRSNQGREIELAVLASGDFFGETTLASPAMRVASARTLEKAQLVGLFRADLLETVQKNPAMANKLLLGLTRVMSERLHAAGQELMRLQQARSTAPAGEE